MDIFKDPKYALLQDMESFSDDMFNRIVAFQERKHPAWDPSRPFDERITGLPLHYLVFSNPDRDPAKFGPTVAPFYPLRDELRTIAHCIRQVAADPLVADAHPGNGFVGSLLAREGVSVIGTRAPDAKRNQIENFFDPNFYAMRDVAFAAADINPDVVFSAWMPSGVNATPDYLARRPKLIVFIYTDHEDDKGVRQTGVASAYSDLPAEYKLIAEWEITRPADLFREVWPDLTGNIEETRKTRIFAAPAFHEIDVTNVQSATPYDWEKELQMALLAHEAKAELRARGFSV